MAATTRSKRPQIPFRIALGAGVILLLAGIATLALPAAAALPPGCTQSGLTVTCSYTTGSTQFVVPKGVSSVSVLAVGGLGACGNDGGTTCETSGGLAARVSADLTVSPGDSLFAVVGGNAVGRLGGANGGGNGTFAADGGGGGASDLRTSQFDLGSRVVVAAGGGGGGARSLGNGGVADANGAAGFTFDLVATVAPAGGGGGGKAGSSAVGGAGGTGGSGSALSGCDGSDGTLLQGGNGSSGCPGLGGGGGGGGGVYGGGGGGGRGKSESGSGVPFFGDNGGGGGGSSLVPPGGSYLLDWTGVPRVEISYTIPLVVAPSGMSFGNQALGSSSATRTATLSVTGSTPMVVGSVALGGAHPGDFGLSADTCSQQEIAAGETCTVQVAFTPTAIGARSATLVFTDDGPDSPQVVTLQGTGTTLADVGVAVSGPASTRAGSQTTETITISNVGPSMATNVVMSAQVPNGTKLVGVSSTQGTCTHPASGSTSGTITCALGDLSAGSAAVQTVTLKITLNAKGGNIVLVAQAASTASNGTAATSDPDLSNNTATLSTTVTKR